jgi:hypothetical protein
MARPVTTLVVFFVSINLIASVFMATGVAAMLHLDANVGGDEAVNDTVAAGKSVSTGSSTGSTLFGMYNVLANQVGGFYDVIYPGLHMFERAGVPGYITDGILGNLFSVLIFIDVVSFVRGWGL